MGDQGFEPGDADREDDGSLHFVVPPEQEAGVYANTFAVWHTGYDFTLDFAASQLPERRDVEDPESPVVVPCRVVSRVRIPAGTVFALIRTINERMGLSTSPNGARFRSLRLGNRKNRMKKADAPTVVNRREIRSRAPSGLTYSRVSRRGRGYTPRPPRKK